MAACECLLLPQQSAVPEPVGEPLWPGVDGLELGTLAHVEAVASRGEDVRFDRHAGILVLLQELERGNRAALVVAGGRQKRRRRGGRHGRLDRERPGINEDREVGPAVEPVDGIGRLRVAVAVAKLIKPTTSPPAENPITPTRFGSTPNSGARLRTVRIARYASALASRSIV